MKQTMSDVFDLSKLPSLPSMLNQKFLSLSLEYGRCIRIGDNSEVQKSKTPTKEQSHAFTASPSSGPTFTTNLRQVAGRLGRSGVLGSWTPRLFNSARRNSPKSPLVSCGAVTQAVNYRIFAANSANSLLSPFCNSMCAATACSRNLLTM